MARKFHLLKSRVRLGQKAVFFPALFWMIFSVFSVYGLFRYVDLKPKVEENFFFSENDPEFQADKKIAEIFPQPPFVIFAVRGDIRSPDYIQRLRHMTRTIAAMPEVLSVQSLTRGPKDLTDAAKSPLWSRVLLTRDGQASLIPVFMHDLPLTVLVPRIEQIRDQFEAPGFEIMISGAPYITELIQRKLFIDFKTFSLAAFLVFGVVVFAVFRSFRILTGIIITCMNASILTLMVTNFFDIKIGLLTANVSTMVFVITLSTIVFFTFNWRLLYEHSRAHSYPLLLQSMRLTLRGSVWSMLTTFLGFLSLLFVQAEPLRQLGIAGSIGTLMAFISAYGIYPWFLSREDDFHWDRHQGAKQDSPQADELSPLLKKKYTERTLHRKFGWVVAVIGVVTVMSGLGLKKTDTDPSLIAYFREGSEIRKGLEYIDRNGGSSLLNITVKDRSGEKLNSRTAHKKMMALHEALEKGPAVGSVISIAVILSEAARNPLTKIITRERLLKILDSGQYGEVAKFFITKDRQQVLYILRMQEEEQGYPRLENVRRIEEVVRANGFVAGLSGGLYVLQGKLSELLYSSLVFGIILLISLFTVMGWILTRSAQTTLALTISLSFIPVCMLGILGHAGFVLDMISAPAANIAIGMGVDSLVHMIVRSRILQGEGVGHDESWAIARLQLWKAVVGNMIIVAAGFGIFALSNFPPTQRFGFSVMLGALLSPFAAIFILPWLACFRLPEKNFGEAVEEEKEIGSS